MPHLGVLEEDDEFEEFAVAGKADCFLAFDARSVRTVVLTGGSFCECRLGRLADRLGASCGYRARRGEVGRGQALGGQLGRRRY